MSITGDRIRQLRKEKHLTLDDVARHLGVGRQAIYKYEQGTVTNIPLENLEKMAALLDTTPGFLAGWKDAEQNNYEMNFRKYARMCMEDQETQELIDIYQSLSHTGKSRLIQSAREYYLLYGKKSESNSAESV